MMSMLSAGNLQDFTNLRKPVAQDHHVPKVEHLRKISATKLFSLKHDKNEPKLKRTLSQPVLPHTERSTLNSFYTPSPCRRYNSSTPTRISTSNLYQRNSKRRYQYARQCSDFSASSSSSQSDLNSVFSEKVGTGEDTSQATYQNLYELIQAKLTRFNQQQKIFSKNSLSEGCYELRKQADNDKRLQEDWEQSLRELEAAGKLDSNLIEAIYLLRNAHLRENFARKESVKCEVDNGDASATSHNGSESTGLYSPSQSSFDSMSLPSGILYSSTESTPVNTSSPSSGHSTPTIKRRPKRPDIKLSDHRNYKDYIEIRRTESVSSLNSDMDGSITSDGSFLHIPDEAIAQAVLSSLNSAPPDLDSSLHEFEETLRESSDAPTNNIKIKSNEVQQLCEQRPESPTSEFLLPILLTSPEAIMNELHRRLSPILHKLKQVEDESKKMSSLHVKLAVLQEEKRQLTAMLEQKRSTSKPDHKADLKQVSDEVCSVEEVNLVQSAPDSAQDKHSIFKDQETSTDMKTKEVGVQKFFEIFTEIAHQGTSTDIVGERSIGVGDCVVHINFTERGIQNAVSNREFSCQNDIHLSNIDRSTATMEVYCTDAATGDNIAELSFVSAATQSVSSQVSSATQSVQPLAISQAVMVGTAYGNIIDTGTGDEVAVIGYSNQETQYTKTKMVEEETQTTTERANIATSVGCSLSSMVECSVQCVPAFTDFACGDNIAECITSDVAVCNVPAMSDVSTGTTPVHMEDCAIFCNITNDTSSIGIGDGSIYDILCDKCSNTYTRDVGAGVYVNDQLCCVTDTLCDCVKPECKSIAIGEHSIVDVLCDKCENLRLTSIGVGDHTLGDLLCDKCTDLKTVTVAVGECQVNDLLCDTCESKGDFVDKGVGDFLINNSRSIGTGDANVNDSSCEKCKDGGDSVFNFDLNILNSGPQAPQQAVLCHYCGNKVDLNDTHLEESLQAMRDSMNSVSCGMKRTTASKNLNLELDAEDSAMYSHKDGSLDSPISDEHHAVDDDEEEDAGSGRNDVIEACQMLHHHFSGEKPLKQQQMLKYMGIIQTLWFKTVKRRRANASVVKSYIDLFQQRIPELMETIINLADDEGNTALHYALTYKNYAVVSILLDSRECSVDLVNQAGYSPIMLAALAGFEKKNDKYIMQRLLRMGDINKESADTGQTPLMLAVSRGNLGTVDLLLDAGCDINAIDDEGSTALMCSCEHGNINIVKTLLAHPECDATIEDNEGSTALSIAMDARRKDLALLIYGSLNFDARGRIKLSPSKQSLLGLGRRSPSPVIGRR